MHVESNNTKIVAVVHAETDHDANLSEKISVAVNEESDSRDKPKASSIEVS